MGKWNNMQFAAITLLDRSPRERPPKVGALGRAGLVAVGIGGCVVRGSHSYSGEETANVLMRVSNCATVSRTLRLITGSMVLADASSSEVRDCSCSSSGTSRTRQSRANMSEACAYAVSARMSGAGAGVV
jgi:hypothetical protein